jgi:hypothetical protein
MRLPLLGAEPPKQQERRAAPVAANKYDGFSCISDLRIPVSMRLE